MKCIKSIEWDRGTTKRLSKNLSYPSGLGRIHTCCPAADLLRLWEVGWTLKKGLRIQWDSSIRHGHFVSTDDKWKVSIVASCEDTKALQQQQCRHSRPRMGFQRSHGILLMEQSCTDVLWKWRVWKGVERVVPGNDSLGGKSRVSVFGISQLSCLISEGSSTSVYCLYRVTALSSAWLVRNIAKKSVIRSWIEEWTIVAFVSFGKAIFTAPWMFPCYFHPQESSCFLRARANTSKLSWMSNNNE